MRRFTGLLFYFAAFLVLTLSGYAEPLLETHPNGKVRLKGNLDEYNLPHGGISQYDDKGNLVSEKNYAHGVLEGVSRLYYPTGELMTEWAYKNGRRNGVSRGFFRNGQLKDKGYYKDDKLDGKVTMFYADGRLRTEMNFKDDRQEGATKTYSRDGKLEYIYTHRRGQLINRKRFDADGKLIHDQDYPIIPVHP